MHTQPIAPPDLAVACASDIALVGGTTDARIYYGMWQIVGSVAPNPSRLPRPHFIVQRSGKTVVEDFDGDVVRIAISWEPNQELKPT